MRFAWKVLVGLAVVLAIATPVALNMGGVARVRAVLERLVLESSHPDAPPPDKSWITDRSRPGRSTWDRTVTLTQEQVDAIGLTVVAVKNQTEPTILRLFGVTDYDPATVTVVRTQFDSRVDKVLVDLGTAVKIGDPLLELFSTDLAEAKSNYEAAVSQWERDRKVLDYKTPLAKDNTLPRKELIEVENDEAQSRLKMKLTKDKLLVYGLTEKEIGAAKSEDGVQKARMILRSRAQGMVVSRAVVQGNYYTSADLLLTIAPLDHLWVRGGVSELDAEKVEVGQMLRVVFPFSDQTTKSKVDYIDKAIDAESRSAKFRTTIANPEGRFKAGMFVRMMVEIRPRLGRTVIPRSSMVSVDRLDYVYIKKPGAGNVFERRQIFVAKESNDVVIVAEPAEDHRGLEPGELVVGIGALILEQSYEDRLTAEGALLSTTDDADDPFAGSDTVFISAESR